MQFVKLKINYFPSQSKETRTKMYMIKTFMGWGQGWGMKWVGNSERCLKWGGEGPLRNFN